MPLLNAKKKRRIRKVVKLSEIRPLYKQGESCALTIPKPYAKALGWIPGRSKIEIILQVSSSTLILSLIPSKKISPARPDPPVLQ